MSSPVSNDVNTPVDLSSVDLATDLAIANHLVKVSGEYVEKYFKSDNEDTYAKYLSTRRVFHPIHFSERVSLTPEKQVYVYSMFCMMNVVLKNGYDAYTRKTDKVRRFIYF